MAMYSDVYYDGGSTGYYFDGSHTTISNAHRATTYAMRTNTNSYWSVQDFKLYGVSPTITFADSSGSGWKTLWLHLNNNMMEFITSTGDGNVPTLNLGQGMQATRPFRVHVTMNDIYVGRNAYIIGRAYQNQSDGRLKTNLRKIDGAIDKINSLNGFYFDWIDNIEEVGASPQERMKDEVGLIAQDVEKIMPQVVGSAPFDIEVDEKGKETSKSGENYLTIQYEKLVPLLIEGIKEQQSTIDSLTNRIETLEAQLNGENKS
tara:strand:+ start:1351 stop:2133 length:783 start_codon:yes stop_codon:yes gene_type:complete